MHSEPGERGQPRLDVTELTGIDSGLQDRLDGLLEHPATPSKLLSPLARQRRKLVQEDPDVVGVAGDHVQQLVSQHRQLLGGRTSDGGDAVSACQDLVHHAIVDRGEQLFLRPDVVVERTLTQIVGDAELSDAGGVIPTFGEDPS